jgi:nifR3 family TIM-barrel protein
MEDVTDVVFREIVSNMGKPDVLFTEFTSADGLCSIGKEVTIQKLQYTKNQHPIVAQIWGTNTKNIYEAARIVKELQFDGVDINMGCPDKAVMKKGAGAALSKNFKLANEIINAAKEGVENKIPVSVKTRLGYDKIITQEWTLNLLEENIEALTVHGRIAIQKSQGEANWDEIEKVVNLRDKLGKKTVIIGNGDIKSMSDVKDKYEKHNIDGVMIGRGIFSNPWVFEKTEREHSTQEYQKYLFKHFALFEKTWGKKKNFEIMKKFLKMYVNNFPNAAEIRLKAMQGKNREEIERILSMYL